MQKLIALSFIHFVNQLDAVHEAQKYQGSRAEGPKISLVAQLHPFVLVKVRLIGDVAFARSVAKLCPDCRGDIASNNIEVRKIYKQLKQRNAGIEDNDDWSTQDDPRAKTEQLYGKVSKVSTKSAYAPVSTLDEMI